MASGYRGGSLLGAEPEPAAEGGVVCAVRLRDSVLVGEGVWRSGRNCLESAFCPGLAAFALSDGTDVFCARVSSGTGLVDRARGGLQRLPVFRVPDGGEPHRVTALRWWEPRVRDSAALRRPADEYLAIVTSRVPGRGRSCSSSSSSADGAESRVFVLGVRVGGDASQESAALSARVLWSTEEGGAGIRGVSWCPGTVGSARALCVFGPSSLAVHVLESSSGSDPRPAACTVSVSVSVGPHAGSISACSWHRADAESTPSVLVCCGGGEVRLYEWKGGWGAEPSYRSLLTGGPPLVTMRSLADSEWVCTSDVPFEFRKPAGRGDAAEDVRRRERGGVQTGSADSGLHRSEDGEEEHGGEEIENGEMAVVRVRKDPGAGLRESLFNIVLDEPPACLVMDARGAASPAAAPASSGALGSGSGFGGGGGGVHDRAELNLVSMGGRGQLEVTLSESCARLRSATLVAADVCSASGARLVAAGSHTQPVVELFRLGRSSVDRLGHVEIPASSGRLAGLCWRRGSPVPVLDALVVLRPPAAAFAVVAPLFVPGEASLVSFEVTLPPEAADPPPSPSAATGAGAGDSALHAEIRRLADRFASGLARLEEALISSEARLTARLEAIEARLPRRPQ